MQHAYALVKYCGDNGDDHNNNNMPRKPCLTCNIILYFYIVTVGQHSCVVRITRELIIIIFFRIIIITCRREIVVERNRESIPEKKSLFNL